MTGMAMRATQMDLATGATREVYVLQGSRPDGRRYIFDIDAALVDACGSDEERASLFKREIAVLEAVV